MKLHLTVRFYKGDHVCLVTDPCTIRVVGRMMIDGRELLYELLQGTNESTWHSEGEIEEIRDSQRVFEVKGFYRV